MPTTIGIALIAIIVIVLYVVVVGDGTYFGRRFVRFLYDRLASSWAYPTNPRHQLIDREDLLPLLEAAVASDAEARLLDVATGTGRVPRLLAGDGSSSSGVIVGCDLSMAMLTRAAVDTAPRNERCRHCWVHAAAEELPFASDTFSAVTCVEALLNFGRPRRALAEMARVTVAGGQLIITKRGDRLALLLPWKDFTRRRLVRVLESLGYSDVAFSRYRGSVRGSEVAVATKRRPHR